MTSDRKYHIVIHMASLVFMKIIYLYLNEFTKVKHRTQVLLTTKIFYVIF